MSINLANNGLEVVQAQLLALYVILNLLVFRYKVGNGQQVQSWKSCWKVEFDCIHASMHLCTSNCMHMYVCSWKRPTIIQSNHMVINNHSHSNTGMHWMMEKWKLAQLVYLNCQDMRSDSPNRMMLLAG